MSLGPSFDPDLDLNGEVPLVGEFFLIEASYNKELSKISLTLLLSKISFSCRTLLNGSCLSSFSSSIPVY